MIRTCTTRPAIAVALIGTFLFSASSTQALETSAMAKYFQSSAALAAISSAISSVGPCTEPLVFDEQESDGEIALSIQCASEETTVIVNFVTFGDVLLPARFDYAG